MDPPFNKIILKKKFQFDELEKSAKFEAVTKGRQGTVIVDESKTRGIPIVRTTTVYDKPAQQFQSIHRQILKEIGIEFNNALIEIYDDKYRSMAYHTDQSLDLADDSYICLFSCYERSPINTRKLKIRNKETGKCFERTLENNSIVVFSTADNHAHHHSIILEGPDNGCRWLGITFRLSKTFVKFVEDSPYIGKNVLTLATDVEKKEFFRHKGQENSSIDYTYPEIGYTISPSDLLPP
jgi:hypothetical protein